MSRERAVKETVRTELEKFQVGFKFDYGGRHPFVEIDTGEKTGRVALSYTGNESGRNILNVRSDVRKKLRELGAQPWPDRKRECRVGSLGEKLMEAASEPVAELPPVQILTPPPIDQFITSTKEDLVSSTIPTNGPKPDLKIVEKSTPSAVRAYLNDTEVAQVSRMLSANAVTDDEKRLITFKDGWSDERVLKILQAAPGREHLKIDNVINLRQKAFGLTVKEYDDQARNSDRAGDGALLSRLKELEDWKGGAEDRLRALEGAVLG